MECKRVVQIECPKPGGIYGGWIKSDIVGPFKSEAGTEAW
jgi:hypothetical protein